eukprot:1539217-Pyramimonas_sp.AAC.1
MRETATARRDVRDGDSAARCERRRQRGAPLSSARRDDNRGPPPDSLPTPSRPPRRRRDDGRGRVFRGSRREAALTAS